jgi:hypothetical protein
MIIETEGMEMEGAIWKVCSDKPRAFANNADPWHLSSNKERTWCGIKCESWLRIGELEDHELSSAYLCSRCHTKAVKP